MRLYTSTSEEFIEDNNYNRIAGKLERKFIEHFRYHPSPNEISSWQNSLRAMKDVLLVAKLRELGVVLEYRLPNNNQRLDCMLCGEDKAGKQGAVIVELKQWQACEEADGPNEVATLLGGGINETLHPSVQVGNYRRYLQDGHTSFYEGPDPLRLKACSYLHNYPYDPDDHIFSNKFAAVLDANPAFTKDEVPKLGQFLRSSLAGGRGAAVLKRMDAGQERPNPKLLQHLAKMIHGEPAFVLLDEQLVVFDRVLTLAEKASAKGAKTVVMVKGGPGSGKSVIALNLLAELMKRGKNALYATGSASFTKTLRKIIGKKGEEKFTYFMHAAKSEKNALDVLIADEAHRIRKTSNIRFTKWKDRTDRPQIEELLDSAKVPVFFLDDRQAVSPGDTGSLGLIRSAVAARGFGLLEYELPGQFRCAGSDSFVQWVNNTLEIERTPNVMWNPNDEAFDFQVMTSPAEVERAIMEKAALGNSARMMAGYCWPWTPEPLAGGTLAKDVVVGEYKRPWNAPPNVPHLAKGIPKSHLWAYEPGGIDQVGCVYTAQGFEFDYAGVIFGPDLHYDFASQTWVGDKSRSFDPSLKKSKERFEELVKNTYRVLLTRALKGCYVCFLDKDTERFVRSRMEKLHSEAPAQEPEMRADPGGEAFVTCLPFYSLKAAAGVFGRGEEVKVTSWVRVGKRHGLNKDFFVTRVIGHSMSPRIPDGALAIFRKYKGGSRNGRIVLCEHRDISDPETGGSYTVKKYRSEKVYGADGEWKHVKIRLLSLNSGFAPIEIEAEDENEFGVIAELVEVLGKRGK